MNTAADPRYLQVARALRQEIVDGVYPVGSQLPTEHALCDRFSVSRYTVREALRRLREDNLISSKPRAGTMVVPRTSISSYAQDVMSIDDLMAFASGAHLVIQASRMLTVDADLAALADVKIAYGMIRVARRGQGTRGLRDIKINLLDFG